MDTLYLVSQLPTVQTFNSCISRPGVCQCLVVQTFMDNMSKNKPRISMTHIACKSMLLSVVRSSMYLRPGNWMTIELLCTMTGLPMHLVQEIRVNVGTASCSWTVHAPFQMTRIFILTGRYEFSELISLLVKHIRNLVKHLRVLIR